MHTPDRQDMLEINACSVIAYAWGGLRRKRPPYCFFFPESKRPDTFVQLLVR
jgi:hypothetical protein